MTNQRDRVAETTTDSGTGILVLSGAAIGYRTFSAAYGAGTNTEVYYGIIQDLSGEWEIGLGTFLGPSSALRRDLVLSSSNGGALTSFPPGDKMVYATFPAETTLTLRARRTADIPLTLSATGTVPTLKFDATSPSIWFHDTSPVGNLTLTANSATFILGLADTAGTKTADWMSLTGSVLKTYTELHVETSAPKLHITETDSVDPAGRYRHYVNADVYYFQRGLTALWATARNIFTVTGSTGLLDFPSTTPINIAGLTTFTGLGGVNITSAQPILYFTETGSTNGAWRIKADINYWSFQRDTDNGPWTGSDTVISIEGATGQTNFLRNTLFNAPVALSSSFPEIRFDETDQVDPAGRYRFHTQTGIFYFQKSSGAAWAGGTTVWSYNASSDTLTMAAANISLVAPTITGTTLFSSGAPTVRFLETDATSPAGQFGFVGTGSNFYFYKYAGASFASATAVWTFTEAGGGSFSTAHTTKLSTVTGSVEIGSTTISNLVFKRAAGASNYNYIQVTDGAPLRVQGQPSAASWATITGTGGWTVGSDARLKENVTEIPYGLDTVLALRPVAFDWIDDGRHDIGLIAQEVEVIVPEVVEEQPPDVDADGKEIGHSLYTLRKDALVAVLIRAVQELHARLAALEEAA